MRLRVSAIALALSLSLAACTGGGGGDDGERAPSTATPVDEVLARRALGATVHVAGFSIEVERVQLVIDVFRRTVARVDATITNTGPDEATLDVPVALEVGERRIDPLPESVLQDVAPGAARAATFDFGLTRRIDLATPRLLFEADGPHQAVVPFSGAGLVDNAPRTVVIDKPLVAGSVEVAARTAERRVDDPVSHETLPGGRALVVLQFDALRQAGNTVNLTAANLRLRLPDGTAIGVRPDGRSAPNVVLEPGEPRQGLVARFEVPEPVAGRYVLMLIGPYGDYGTEARGEIAFTFDV